AGGASLGAAAGSPAVGGATSSGVCAGGSLGSGTVLASGSGTVCASVGAASSADGSVFSLGVVPPLPSGSGTLATESGSSAAGAAASATALNAGTVTNKAKAGIRELTMERSREAIGSRLAPTTHEGEQRTSARRSPTSRLVSLAQRRALGV